MALVAMSLLNSTFSYAQTDQPRAFSPKIKTPNTSKELKESKHNTLRNAEESAENTHSAPEQSHSTSPRRLQQHGLGLGLGQTFLFGDYSNHGDDKITMDFFYSYAASYSFDLIVNAHMSEHEHRNEEDESDGNQQFHQGTIS
jgi:hypothetical protein